MPIRGMLMRLGKSKSETNNLGRVMLTKWVAIYGIEKGSIRVGPFDHSEFYVMTIKFNRKKYNVSFRICKQFSTTRRYCKICGLLGNQRVKFRVGCISNGRREVRQKKLLTKIRRKLVSQLGTSICSSDKCFYTWKLQIWLNQILAM